MFWLVSECPHLRTPPLVGFVLCAKALILGTPLRHPHVKHVGVDRLGQRLVHMLWPGCAKHPRLDRGAGHRSRAVGHLVADIPHPHDVRVVGLAEEVPDRRGRRYHVRLVAAVADHVVRALLDPQVLAAEVPADVHQLHRVERTPAVPGVSGTCLLYTSPSPRAKA